MCYRLGDLANDGTLKARGLAMLRARANFRFPTIDSSGYFVMQGAEPVGARNDMQMPGHIAYLARASVDTGWGGWHDLLAVSQVNPASNPDIVGWEKQFFTDGQYLPEASGANTSAVDSPYFPDRYAAAKTVATASAVYNLPMTAGQPDFGWVDEENMVLAAKHGSGTGEERFFADLAWRSADSITGLVKIFSLTSTTARIAEVMSDDVQFRPSGQQVFGSSQVEANSSRQPPDNPVSAYGGVPYLTALRDDLSAVPSTNRDAGRAWGYTLRFGHWLAGINGHHSQSYTLKAPSDFTTGTDLVSGTIKAVPVAQPSKSSTVFYLTGTAGANDKPAAPLYVNGIGGTAQVVLTWSAAAGATSYLVERATASGGPFTQVANGITGLTCADMSGIVAGKIYYYRVTGVNGAGSGSPSPQIQAQAGPPSPWTAADIGTVATPGLTGFENGGFTVVGSGGDIGSSADSFQYAYVPLTGDGTITARVANISGSTATSKVGVMMRESLAAGSKHAALTLQNGGGTLKLISRSGTDGGTALGTVYISGVPSWLRLTRTGSVFISSFSTDGKSWTVGDAVTIPMNTAITAGLAVCARTTALNYTNFDHVNAPGWATSLAPSALVASLKNTDVNLAWNPAAGATGYNVKRSTTSGRSYATIASGLTGTTYTDFGLLGSGSGITYDYVVSALNAQGESVDSVESAASMVLPPDPPTSVTITGGNLQAILGWMASDGATSYSIYRSTASGGPYALVKSGVTGTGYVDTGLSSVANTPYFYVVTTSNANGEGIYSTEMEFINSAVTVTGFGIYSGEITLGQSGALTLDNSSGAYASSVTRGAGLLVAGGLGFTGNAAANLSIVGSPTGGTNDFLGSLFLSSGALFGKVTPNTASNTTLTFSDVSRRPGTQLDFGHQAIGTAPLTSPAANTRNVVFTIPPTTALAGGVQMVGSNGTGSNVNILPFAFVNNDLTTYDAAYGLRALNTNTEMATLGSGMAAGQNAKTTGGTVALSGTTAVNALYLGGGTVTGTGTLAVTSGTVVANVGASFGNATLAFGSAEAQINVANIRTLTINSVITGSGGLTVGLENLNASTASLVLGGANLLAGITTLTGNNPALKTVLTHPLALQSSTLDYNNYGASLQFGNAATSLTAATFGGLRGAQNLALLNADATPQGITLSVGGDGDSTAYDGILSGTGSVVKIGSGVLILTGTNTYSGATTISDGTLLVNGSLAASPVVVNRGAALGGTGTVSGLVTVATGGALTPGNSAGPGVMTFGGGLTLNGGSLLNLALADAATTGKIALTGNYTGPVNGMVTVNVSALAGFGARIYPVITGATGIAAGSFVIGAVPAGYTVTPSVGGGRLSLIVAAYTPLQAWRQANFGTTSATGNAADAADPDGDGRSNLLEYATGTNPNVADPNLAATLGTNTDGTRLTLTFNRGADPTLTYNVMACDDLTAAWTVVWTSTGAQNIAGTVTATDSELLANHSKRFLRLQISH